MQRRTERTEQSNKRLAKEIGRWMVGGRGKGGEQHETNAACRDIDDDD